MWGTSSMFRVEPISPVLAAQSQPLDQQGISSFDYFLHPTSSKKWVVKVDAYGEAHFSSTFNNVIVTLTNSVGQVISWSSAGKMGFRGSKKNTPYAAQVAAADAAKVAYDLGLRSIKAYVKGPGAGRESAIRTLDGAGIKVTEIIDVTPLPHNGCRPKGRRRV